MARAPVVATLSCTTAPVHINVGGTLYTSSLETLTRFPHSKLGKFFNGSLPIPFDSDKHQYFFDRDGKTFRHVLNFLRSSKLILPDNYGELKLLFEEAVYFEIEDLRRDIQQFMDNRIKTSKKIEINNINGEHDVNSTISEAVSAADEISSHSIKKNKKKKPKTKQSSTSIDKSIQGPSSKTDQDNDISVCTATVKFLADKFEYECPITRIKNRATVEQGDIREVKWRDGEYYKAKILNIENDGRLKVQYLQDNCKHRTSLDCVKNCNLQVNDIREVKWTNGKYYLARVLKIGSMKSHIDNNETTSCLEEENNRGQNQQNGYVNEKGMEVNNLPTTNVSTLNNRELACIITNPIGGVQELWCSEEHFNIEGLITMGSSQFVEVEKHSADNRFLGADYFSFYSVTKCTHCPGLCDDEIGIDNKPVCSSCRKNCEITSLMDIDEDMKNRIAFPRVSRFLFNNNYNLITSLFVENSIHHYFVK